MFQTVGDALDNIRQKLDDIPTAGEGFWSDGLIISAIDEACNVISSRAFCLQTEISWNTVAGQYKYTLPTDFLKVISVYYEDIPLNFTGIYSDNYRPTSTGTPSDYYVRFGSLCIVPAPSESGKSVTMEYYQLSPHVTTSSDSISIPARFHFLIPLYCLAVLLPKDTMFNQAAMFMDMFQRRLNEEIIEANQLTISPKYIRRMQL